MRAELMASPQRQAMAFGVLSGISAVLGVLCCVEPESVIGIALPDVSAAGRGGYQRAG